MSVQPGEEEQSSALLPRLFRIRPYQHILFIVEDIYIYRYFISCQYCAIFYNSDTITRSLSNGCQTEQTEQHPGMEEEIVETPEEQLAKQHRKEKKDMQGS